MIIHDLCYPRCCTKKSVDRCPHFYLLHLLTHQQLLCNINPSHIYVLRWEWTLLCFLTYCYKIPQQKQNVNPLYCNYSKNLHNGKYKDCNKANRCNIFNNYGIESFYFKFPVYLSFFDNRLRLDHISDKNAGKEGNNWHQNAVADKIKEIKQRHSKRSQET